jgi:hypothetical protein
MPLEQHFRVSDLAKLWCLSDAKVRDLFTGEPGVMRIEGPSGRYATLSIPESVALRVRSRLSQQPLQSSGASGNPRRVVLLRNQDRRVSKQTRNIIRLKAS